MDIREIISTEAECYFNLRVLLEEEFPEFVGFNAERELSVGFSGISE